MREPRSNREWIFWGRHDPLFAVATAPGKEAGGESPWTAEAFYESGRRYFADVRRQWEQYGMPAGTCVEIGCGAGRITKQLARSFDHVVAVDVSDGQLECARRLLGTAAVNVAFTLISRPELPVPAGSCQGVFSCEVFQHFDPPEPLLVAYVREAARVLASGGTFCFQVPVRGLQGVTMLASPARRLVLRVLRVLGRRRMMIYQLFDAPCVIRTLGEAGFRDVDLRTFHAAEQDGHHSYSFARRP